MAGGLSGMYFMRSDMQKAKEEGASDLSLLVFENNYEAIRLYKKLGFKIKLIPALKEQLEKDKLVYGRRIVLNKSFIS